MGKRVDTELHRRAGSRFRPLVVVAGDAARIAAAYLLVLILRFDGAVPDRYWERFFWFLPVALAAHLVLLWTWRVYDEIWNVASIREARRLTEAMIMATTLLLAVDLAAPHRLPVSVVVFGGGMATAVIGGSRFQRRLLSSARSAQRHDERGAQRVAILGAGDAGAAVIRSLEHSRGHGLVPVVALDDSRRLHGLTLLGVPVAGAIEDLSEVASVFDVDLALLCIPNAPPDVVERAAAAAEEARITLKIVPAVEDVLRGRPAASSVRAVAIEDLLGRKQVETDLAAVGALVHGRRVLITGAGGSIGSEMARQVAALEPATLVLLDHDETHLYDIASDIDHPTVQVLADIRDAGRISELFRQHRPDVVFHAAAHKHVPLLESHPSEAVRTNVLGTANLLAAADSVATDRFVLISTDKAVDPRNVMGATKALCEQLTIRASRLGSGCFCAVRFGNVLGSRGSVIPTFSRQIARGGPVTVTDPEMTRFFMSTTEAVQLVLQASAMTTGGELFMLEMGQPVNILDLAERMIRLSGLEVGRDIEIRIIGSRPGEKIHERLVATGDQEEPTVHPSIKRLRITEIPEDRLVSGIGELTALAESNDESKVATSLLAIVGSTQDQPEDDRTWSSATTS